MNDVEIVKLLPEHAREVAKLHVSGIHTGFISSLGVGFVTSLYQAIAASESAFGFVAKRQDEIIGFVAFTTNVNELYRSIIFRNGVRFALALSRSIFSWETVRAVLETLFYPRRVKKLNLPSAELLSIVVSPEARVKGLATELTCAGFVECQNKGIEKVKVLVGVDNIPANKLYLKCGFEMVAEINNHGILSNIYVAQTVAAEKEKSRLEAYKVAASVNPPVFVTYSWCRSSYAIVLSLGRRGIDVHVGDAAPFAMSRFSRYCKSFTRLPEFFIEPERYFRETCRALKKTGSKVLMPGHEDVGIFSKRRDELPSDVHVALPEWDSYQIAEDKFAVLDLAEKTGCPVPDTMEIGSIQELENFAESSDWPVVIKTRIGNSAKGVRIARSSKELVQKFEELVQTYNLPKNRWPVVQEFLPGDAAGVCLAYNRGRCIASFAERYLRCKEPGKFGTSTLRETYDNHQLINNAIGVMDKLKWHGVAHLDFVADKTGQFKLIEINPRLWGALALALFSGIDFPYLWYLTAINRSNPESVELQKRKIKCRWLIGDCLALFELVKRARFAEAAQLIVPQRNCYHDDFTLRDPLPLLFEICDYFSKFIKSGGSINPVIGDMIR